MGLAAQRDIYRADPGFSSPTTVPESLIGST